MNIRLQDALVTLAHHNGLSTQSAWPLLLEYLRWFLSGGGGTWTSDQACRLYWMSNGGKSLSDYWGVNISSLTDRIMSAVWRDFLDIHCTHRRTAYVLDRIRDIAHDHAVHALLADAHTTLASLSEFALQHGLAVPPDLQPKAGRKAGLHYESWCHQAFDRLVRGGIHTPHEGGLTRAATQVHQLLGGKVDAETARKALAGIYAEHIRRQGKALKTRHFNSRKSADGPRGA